MLADGIITIRRINAVLKGIFADEVKGQSLVMTLDISRTLIKHFRHYTSIKRFQHDICILPSEAAFGLLLCSV
jgi:hypothetical protein